MLTIRYGYCHCGCGELARIATRSDAHKNMVKGEPKRFLRGHQEGNARQRVKVGPFKIDGVYCCLIPLTRGLYAIVDESDYEWLNQWVWFARRCQGANRHYAVRTESKTHRAIQMHRFILGMDDADQRMVDHVEPDQTLDNRRKNIRPASGSQNQFNRKTGKNSTSGIKGVSLSSSEKWRARISVHRKEVHLGTFATKQEALDARREAAARMHGEFARTA